MKHYSYNPYSSENNEDTLLKLVGLKIKSVEGLSVDSDEATFNTECGRRFKMYHRQDCCESVSISDICGDIGDLINAEIIHFEERSNSGDESSEDKPGEWCESFTWTFYDIQTTKGCVNIRWLGESDGYCSESVSFAEGECKHES